MSLRRSVNGLSVSPVVNAWLATTRQPRILHIFDRACNLINERREVLSVVTRQIGDGPFHVVIEDDIVFSERTHLESAVCISANQLALEDLTIRTDEARLWSPRPDWERLHAYNHQIATKLFRFRVTNPQVAGDLASTLALAISCASLPASLAAARKLAGLGAGLTPAGDDFILGAIYAAWIIHDPEIAINLAREIASVAAPLTTSLSAAWLKSAGQGEAGILWHDFFDSFVLGDTSTIQLQITRILAVGHTSGADAFAGFAGTLGYWLARRDVNKHLFSP